MVFNLTEENFLIESRDPDTAMRKLGTIHPAMMEKDISIDLDSIRHRGAFVNSRFLIRLPRARRKESYGSLMTHFSCGNVGSQE